MAELLKDLKERRKMFPWSLACTVSDAEMDAIIAALKDCQRLRAAAQEVWDSVPASYEPADLMVRRHAAALIALGTALEGGDG